MAFSMEVCSIGKSLNFFRTAIHQRYLTLSDFPYFPAKYYSIQLNNAKCMNRSFIQCHLELRKSTNTVGFANIHQLVDSKEVEGGAQELSNEREKPSTSENCFIQPLQPPDHCCQESYSDQSTTLKNELDRLRRKGVMKAILFKSPEIAIDEEEN